MRITLLLLILLQSVLHGSDQLSSAEALASAEGLAPAEMSETALRYPLQPFDQVAVQVFQQSELSASQRISDVGTVALPLVGEIKIAGLTTTEAQRTIASAYIDQEYLVNPIVTVTIVSFTPQTVTVLGELGGGGQVSFPDGVQKLPIQEVVAKAGDFSDIAKSTEVRIERRIPGQDEPKIFIVDVKKIIESTKNNQAVDTFMVQPGDIIFVPRRAF